MSSIQVDKYNRDGYVLIDNVLSADEIRMLRSEVKYEARATGERVVYEKNSNIVRSIYGVHSCNRFFDETARQERIVEPVKNILKNDVYVYQSKVNLKGAFDGDVWDWHQDYVYWQKEDGMPASKVLTVAVFLDEVTEFNGPLMLIPGSHRHGILSGRVLDSRPAGYEDKPGWIANLTADLKYTIDRNVISELVQANGIVSAKASAGSVLIFDGNIVHASPANISPLARTLLLYTYNRVDNAPDIGKLHRPDFLVSRDSRPIQVLHGSIREPLQRSA